MKRTVLILAALLLIGGTVFLFATDSFVQETALEKIAIGTDADTAGLKTDSDLLLTLSYGDIRLPVNEDGTVLIPVIPESGIAVLCDKDAALIQSSSQTEKPSGVYRSTAITVIRDGSCRTITLTETHMPVLYLVSTDSDAEEPFGDKEKNATVTALSAGEDGGLLVETGNVSVRYRGNSSRIYEKKGYTFTNLDERGYETARSFLGFAPNTQFGLNSLFEDDVKLRDIFSLDVCASTLPEGTRDTVLRMQYTELYINGRYAGLYGIKEILTPEAVGIGSEDALVKMNVPYTFTQPATSQVFEKIRSTLDVRRDLPNGSITDTAMEIVEKIAEKDPSALDFIDRESLIRYALWVQVLSADHNTSKNIVGIWRADAGRFFLTIYDTDRTFGYVWSAKNPPAYCIQDPDLAEEDSLRDVLALGRLIHLDAGNMTALAELYFSLRDSVLSEETLLARLNELFNRATDSGARERDRLRWPASPTTDTPEEIETFIKRRLVWCDTYFAAYLEEA